MHTILSRSEIFAGVIGKELSHWPVVAGSHADLKVIVNVNWNGLGRWRKICLEQTWLNQTLPKSRFTLNFHYEGQKSHFVFKAV